MEIFIPEHARQAIDILEHNGYTAYAVGGCIRDSLLGKTPHDWDICTNCRPEKNERNFLKASEPLTRV